MVDESGIPERDRIIAVLKQKLHEKDIFISQQRREIARLKAIEGSLFWKMAKGASDLTYHWILPPGSTRGRFVQHLLRRWRGGLQAGPQNDEQWKGNLLLSTYHIDPIEQITIPEMDSLDFSSAGFPKVSIIIPTWNKVLFLYYCLKSILENSLGTAYEIVVVDNGSTDETPELLKQTQNITVVSLESNLGFVKACNEGAKIAKGEYLLFLNNDTQVTEDWLKEMVDLADGDKTIGAVGGELIYPNGSLQEAGSMIWRDGSALGYGRGGDPDAPQFNYLRDVDFCSGACLFVGRELFLRLGGFSEVYSPAYYEDADLCMGVMSLGLRVVYHPGVKIIHHEFGSTSKEKSMELCLKNQGKFRERWAGVLEDHLPPGPEKVLQARDRRKGVKILVLDDIIPASSMGSGFPRSNALLRDLVELGYVVTFFPLSDSFPYQPYTSELQRMGVEVFYGGGLSIQDLLRERQGFYDAILISRPHNAAMIMKDLKKYFPNARIIYDAEAIYANRDINRLKLNGIEVKEEKQRAMIAKELAPMKYADSIIVTSEYERKQVAAYRTDHVYVWGHPLEIEVPERKFKDRENLLFVGGFLLSPSPNEDAMLHFVKDIFPKVRETLGCRLFIVGTNHLESVKKLVSDSVKVTGYVENLKSYYERSRVFVVPTRFAAGIPLKLLEAMSYGIPAVVTPLVASQLGLSDREGILIGRDDGDFARKVVELYQNEGLWCEIQEKALHYVETNCDQKKMKEELDTIVKPKKVGNGRL